MTTRPSVEGGASLSLPPDCRTETVGITFFDLSRLAEWSSSEDDERVADFLQRFYALSAKCLEPAGCRIVKFTGDAGLAVFPTESAEDAIDALSRLASETREMGREIGFDIRVAQIDANGFETLCLEARLDGCADSRCRSRDCCNAHDSLPTFLVRPARSCCDPLL